MTHFSEEVGSPLHTPILSPLSLGPSSLLAAPAPQCRGSSLCTGETCPGRLAKAVTSLGEAAPPRLASPVPPHLLPAWLPTHLAFASCFRMQSWSPGLLGTDSDVGPFQLTLCHHVHPQRPWGPWPRCPCFASFEPFRASLGCPALLPTFSGLGLLVVSLLLPRFHCITQASLNLDLHSKGWVSLISV